MTIAGAKKQDKQMKNKQELERDWSEGSAGKESPLSAEDTRDPGLIPESGKSPGGGNGNPLRYSGLENSMDRGAWQAIVHGIMKNWKRLSKHSSWSTSLGRTVTLV